MVQSKNGLHPFDPADEDELKQNATDSEEAGQPAQRKQPALRVNRQQIAQRMMSGVPEPESDHHEKVNRQQKNWSRLFQWADFIKKDAACPLL